MTSAEFKTFREAYGLTAAGAGALFCVALRTVQHWEAGAGPIPDDAARALRNCIERIDGLVGRAVDRALVRTSNQPLRLIRYPTDAALWRALPAWRNLPVACHTYALARIHGALRQQGIVASIVFQNAAS